MNMSDRKHVSLVVFFALTVLTSFLMATPALAQQPTADQINAVAKNLNCPTCTGINVADCPTETCAQWRAQIGDMLAQGKSEQEILDYFAARYGDHVLQVPPKRGFFVWVWVLPILAILAGLAWLAYLMRVWLRQRAAVPADVADIAHSSAEDDAAEDEYLRRVQQDLEKLS
jgi:cytochrome c-type biogenesis protein CcmH